MFEALDQIPPEGISREELEKLQERAAVIQEYGLRLTEQYLTDWVLADGKDYIVTPADSDEPLGYDFAVIDETGKRYLCVKSTEGSFRNVIHISYAELLQMREAAKYDLYRVYEVEETRATLRIARNMKAFAKSNLEILERLPQGVRPDSISVTPEILDFESVVQIEIPDAEE